MADGKITVPTEVDMSGIAKGAKEIVKLMREASNSLQGASAKNQNAINKQITSFEKMGISVIKQAEKVQNLRDQIESLDNMPYQNKEFAKLESDIEKAETKLKELQSLYESQSFLQMDYKTGEMKRMPYGEQGSKTAEQIAQQENLLATLRDSQSKINPIDEGKTAEKNAELVQKLAEAEEVLRNSNTRLDESYQSLHNKLEENGADLSKLNQVVPQDTSNNMSMYLDSGESKLKGYLSYFKSFIGYAKNFSNALHGLKGKADKATQSVKRMLMLALGARSLFTLLRKMRSYLGEGFKNLASYSDEFNSAMSKMKSSSAELKNNLASAFEPIANAVIPIITQLIDYLNTACEALSKFFAIIGNKKTYTVAKKQTIDYAESLDSASESAKGALASFDKLDVLNNSSSSSSGGEATGADAFEEVETPSLEFDSWGEAFSNFLDWLSTDGVPSLIDKLKEMATKANEINQKLYDMFKYEGVREKIRALGEQIGEGLNEVVNIFNWELAGRTLGAGLNLALNFLERVIYTFDWVNLGRKLGEFINGFIDEIEWYEVGLLVWGGFKIAIETFAGLISSINYQNVVDGIFDFLTGAINGAEETLDNLPWKDLVNAIEECIIAVFVPEGTNVEKLGRAIVRFIAKGIGVSVGLIGTLSYDIAMIPAKIAEQISQAIADNYDTTKTLGQNIVDGMLQGILDGLASIGDWIVENIFNPFIEGFQNAFDIHSPSKVMEEQGQFLMQGLLDGITSLFDSVVEKFTVLKEKIIDVWNKIRSKTGTIWQGIASMIKKSVNQIIGFINKMISAVVDGINTLIDALNAISIDPPDWFTERTGITKFGFNLARISAPQIPYLASGAVLPANKPFLAMLGDQKNGNNLEAPEGLIRQIMREEMANMGVGNITINASGDLAQFIEMIRFELQNENERVGNDFLVRTGGI